MSPRKQVGRTRFFCYLPIRRINARKRYNFSKKMNYQRSIAAWPVMFRYSEVLFNKAEALMRKNRCAKWQS